MTHERMPQRASLGSCGLSDSKPLGYTFRCAYCNLNRPMTVGRKKTAKGWKCVECFKTHRVSDDEPNGVEA